MTTSTTVTRGRTATLLTLFVLPVMYAYFGAPAAPEPKPDATLPGEPHGT